MILYVTALIKHQCNSWGLRFFVCIKLGSNTNSILVDFVPIQNPSRLRLSSASSCLLEDERTNFMQGVVPADLFKNLLLMRQLALQIVWTRELQPNTAY